MKKLDDNFTVSTNKGTCTRWSNVTSANFELFDGIALGLRDVRRRSCGFGQNLSGSRSEAGGSVGLEVELTGAAFNSHNEVDGRRFVGCGCEG